MWRVINTLCVISTILCVMYLIIEVRDGIGIRDEIRGGKYITYEGIDEYQNRIKNTPKNLNTMFTKESKDVDNKELRYEVMSSELVGDIIIPKIGVNEKIRIGATSDILKYSIGLVEGYDIPDNKLGYSSLVAGHRGYAGISNYFLYINFLKKGDKIYIERGNKRLEYEVTTNIVVGADDSGKIRRDPNKSVLTLVTCTPMFVWDKRILVESELVGVDILK